MNDVGTPLEPEELTPRAEGASEGAAEGASSKEASGEAPKKRTRKGASHVPRPASRGESRLPGILAALAALLLLGSSPLWAPLLLRRLAFFRLRRVEILGARYVAPGDILARLHVDTLASVWDPTAPLGRRVAELPGVRSVDIRRKLPGTLVVDITERVPVALVPTAQGFQPYDEHGTALPIDPARNLVDAPILDRRNAGVLRLLGRLRQDEPALYQRVSEVREVGADELLFELLPSVPVRAMKDVSAERLADIEPVESDLARRRLRPAELDLRYRDQVIARIE